MRSQSIICERQLHDAEQVAKPQPQRASNDTLRLCRLGAAPMNTTSMTARQNEIMGYTGPSVEITTVRSSAAADDSLLAALARIEALLARLAAHLGA